jgi:multiple sugar transport system substrate-binding protein
MRRQKALSLVALLALLSVGVIGAQGQEVVELTYARYAGHNPIDLEFVEAFMEENPDIKINVVDVPGEESFNTLFLQMQGGEMPDVFWSHWVLAGATSGMAIPLDDYIEQAGGEEFIDRFVPSAWNFVEWQGHYYGVQWRDGASVMYLNGDLLEAAGQEVPEEWDWDMLLEYAQALTDEEEGTYGLGLIGAATDPGTEWNFWPFLLQNGGQIIDPETYRAAFNREEGVAALQFMVDLIHEYKVAPPGTASNDVNEIIDLFVSGKIAMWANGPWYIGIMKNTYPDVVVTVAVMPKEVTQGSIAGGTAFCISSQSEHPDEAWRFIEYMTSDENLTEWALVFEHVPPNVAGFEHEFFDDPSMAAAVAQSLSPDTIAANHFPETDQLNQIMRTYLQAAYLQEMTPQEALDAAAAEWDEILAQYD